MGLSTKARPSFYAPQVSPIRCLHKLLSLIHQGADRRSKKNHNATAARTKITLQKVNQDEKVECYVKGQDKTPEKQLNEVEIGNFPEKEFRIMVVKMIQDLGKRMEKMQEIFTKDLKELKNKQR